VRDASVRDVVVIAGKGHEIEQVIGHRDGDFRIKNGAGGARFATIA